MTPRAPASSRRLIQSGSLPGTRTRGVQLVACMARMTAYGSTGVAGAVLAVDHRTVIARRRHDLCRVGTEQLGPEAVDRLPRSHSGLEGFLQPRVPRFPLLVSLPPPRPRDHPRPCRRPRPSCRKDGGCRRTIRSRPAQAVPPRGPTARLPLWKPEEFAVSPTAITGALAATANFARRSHQPSE